MARTVFCDFCKTKCATNHVCPDGTKRKKSYQGGSNTSPELPRWFNAKKRPRSESYYRTSGVSSGLLGTSVGETCPSAMKSLPTKCPRPTIELLGPTVRGPATKKIRSNGGIDEPIANDDNEDDDGDSDSDSDSDSDDDSDSEGDDNGYVCDDGNDNGIDSGDDNGDGEGNGNGDGDGESNDNGDGESNGNVESNDNGDSGDEFPLVAIKYLKDAVGDYFGVWWDHKDRYTEEPWSLLTNIGQETLMDLKMNRPGVKVYITGARHGSEHQPDPHTTRNDNNTKTALRKIKHQHQSGFCALNAVINLVDLPEHLVTAIKSKGPTYSHTEMSRQILQTKGCSVRLRKVKHPSKIEYLKMQTAGKFLVYFGGHCISWDSDDGVLMDTHPDYPYALPITPENIAMLGADKVTLVYRIEHA